MAFEMWELDNAVFGENKPAWHGAGVVVKGCVNGKEASRIAGLDKWRAVKEGLFDRYSNSIGGYCCVCRDDLPSDDSRRILGIHTDAYEVVQHTQLPEVGDIIVGDHGAHYETAGSLKNGRVVWYLLKLDKCLKINSDVIDQYILLTTSHDGSVSFTIGLTLIRVVCWNTLQFALNDNSYKYKGRHRLNIQDRIKEIAGCMQNLLAHGREQGDRLNRLAECQIEDVFAQAAIYCLYPDREKGNNTKRKSVRSDIYRLYKQTLTGQCEATTGTAYGLYNAFTEYLDHRSGPVSSLKSEQELVETRFASTMMDGTIARKRQEAYNLVARMTGVDDRGMGLIEQVLERTDGDDKRASSMVVDSILGGLDLS